MYLNQRILAIIPAREGSKGIKDKNIYPVDNKPLIGYTIESAKKSKYIDRVVVSTDGERIAAISKEFGADVPFLRPQKYGLDTSKTLDAIIYTINELIKQGNKYDVLVLLQPTSPLRTEEDIDSAITVFFSNKMQPLASVSKVDDHPLLIRTIDNDGKMKNLLNVSSTCRRQDMTDYYKINGSIYINRINEINNSTSFNDNYISYIMEKSHSVDIDEMIDLYMVNYYLNYNQ